MSMEEEIKGNVEASSSESQGRSEVEEKNKKTVLIGIAERECPKCGSIDFYIEYTTVGERYEKCQECGYAEKDHEPQRYEKVRNERFNPRNYIEDDEGKYHEHGKYGWHKVERKHRPVEGEVYSFEEMDINE